MRKNKNSALAFFFLLTAFQAQLYAAVPFKINFQGRLEESSQAVSGTRNMVFKIYDSSSGETLIWTSETSAVQVTNGLFSVTLQTGTPVNLSTGIFSSAGYIEVSVDGATLLPRQEIISSPYSFVAQTLADNGCSDNQILSWDSSAGSWLCSDISANSLAPGNYLNDVKVSSAIYADNAEMKLAKSGGTVTGQLTITPSSFTVLSSDTLTAALWVSTSPATPHLYVSTSGKTGIGTSSPNSSLQIAGSMSIGVTDVNSNYALTDKDHIAICNANSGTITLTLPSAAGIKGRIYIIKKTDDSLNSVLIDPNGAETIDQYPNFELANQDESVTLVSDGINWQVLGFYY